MHMTWCKSPTQWKSFKREAALSCSQRHRTVTGESVQVACPTWSTWEDGPQKLVLAICIMSFKTEEEGAGGYGSVSQVLVWYA